MLCLWYYLSPFWNTCNKTLKDELQIILIQAARMIDGASHEIRAADVLRAVEWKDLSSPILSYPILS